MTFRIRPPGPTEATLRVYRKAGAPYNRLNREIDRRREGGGWVRISDETEQCPWSEGVNKPENDDSSIIEPIELESA